MSNRPLCTYDEDQVEIDRILALSDEEVRAEMLAEGIDPDQAAADMNHEIAVLLFLREKGALDDVASPAPTRTAGGRT
ncbi:hypothetical protein G3T14_21705 [Methylobacterium sp. BTF04]|uniref:hypothetical protein n=1 Tax=Methylobacterium sp. BTF04 TaxID=2708300 RepID=UPI0013D25E1C|nr:hypothetical protein [Methylobacterium sp. BTF04]NEU14698.1 hypothetical protein [Methylobacterium sp. BTF04]